MLTKQPRSSFFALNIAILVVVVSSMVQCLAGEQQDEAPNHVGNWDDFDITCGVTHPRDTPDMIPPSYGRSEPEKVSRIRHWLTANPDF